MRSVQSAVSAIAVAALAVGVFGGCDGSSDDASPAAHTGDATGAVELTVVGLQGNAVSTLGPGDGQVLVWNDSASEWVPADHDHTGEYVDVSGDTMTGPLTTTDLAYSSARTRHYAVSPCEWTRHDNGEHFMSNGHFFCAPLDSGVVTAYAPIHLPGGATVTSAEVWYVDNTTNNFNFRIHYSFVSTPGTPTLAYASYPNVASTGESTDARMIELTATDTVDNTIRALYIFATWTAQASGGANSQDDMAIGPVFVEYSVDTPLP